MTLILLCNHKLEGERERKSHFPLKLLLTVLLISESRRDVIRLNASSPKYDPPLHFC